MIAALWLVALVTHGMAAPHAQREAVATDLSQPRARSEAQIQVLASMIQAGLYKEALSVSAQLRATGMDDPALDLLEAEAMHAEGMSDQAEQLLRGLVKKRPRSPAGWAVLGIVLADKRDTAGAIHALERAHRLAPRDARVLNNLGYLLLARGQGPRAVEMFTAAVTQDPSNPRIRNNLGFALAHVERDTEALAAFRAAGTEADARYNLGVACELRGDTAAALTSYQAAVAASPDHAPAAAALARLLHLE